MFKQFTTFYLGESLFAIDVLLVREINRNLEITDVSPAPDFLRGLMNLRGQIVAVTDLGIRLGLGKRTFTSETCCIVLKTTNELDRLIQEGMELEETSSDIIGLIVDRIGDMVSIDSDHIEPSPANMNGVDGRYLNGVIQLENQLVAILKTDEILKLETV